MFDYLAKFFAKQHRAKVYSNLENEILVIRDLRKTISERAEKIEGLDEVMNVSHYFSLCFFDIFIIYEHLIHSNHKQEKNFFARVSAHTIHEVLDDLNGLFEKKFRDRVESLSNKSQLQNLNKVLKELYLFKKNNFLKLKKMRNQTFGHREKNAKEQDDIIDKIDIEEVLNLTNQIINLCIGFIKWTTIFYINVMEKIHKSEIKS